MELKISKETELDQIVEFCFQKNSKQSSYVAFCCVGREHIYDDLKFIIQSKEHLLLSAWDGGRLCGVLGLFDNEEIKRMDCVGPFVDGDYQEIGEALIRFGREQKPGYEFNFCFHVKNKECLQLVNQLGAHNEGNEQILCIKRADYKMELPKVEVVPMPASYEQQLKELHNTIFPGLYLTGNELIESLGKERKAYVILEHHEIAAYGILEPATEGSKSATAEIIAVEQHHRGMGYGRAIVNEILHQGFLDDQVEKMTLIVDNANPTASSLYHSVGFNTEAEHMHFVWN